MAWCLPKRTHREVGLKRNAWLVLLPVAALLGCPAEESTGGTGDADNPVTRRQVAYCKPMCLKYQECNLAVFNLKWGTLEACELECNPFTEVSACNAQCDVAHAADEVAHATCIVNCERRVSVDACKTSCDQISEPSAHASCLTGCNKSFSQACADVMDGIHQCYLGLECERAIIYRDFGGSASDLGECLNDDARDTSC